MNILYIHGWASKFDPTSTKLSTLSKLGNIYGLTIDYTASKQSVIDQLLGAVDKWNIDVVIGTSFGGYLASKVGEIAQLPFVSINPVIAAHDALGTKIGSATTYSGEKYTLTRSTVDEYGNNFQTSFRGLVLLDSGDTVLNSAVTKSKLSPNHTVKVFEGGSHRFEHITEALPIIQFYVNNQVEGLTV
jgi:predicted esterase YcpF (UPF0227 family)